MRARLFVKWTDEDECYIGYCPDLFFGGVCHGACEEATYAELCAVVRAEVDHRLAKGEELPRPFLRATQDANFVAV